MSDIYQKMEHKNLLSAPHRELSGFLIMPMIIGDSAFSNWSWIIKPYPNHAVLTPTERLFNAKLCKVRCTVVRAFVLLKSRWQIILKQNEQKFKSIGRTVTAAVVIHNFCQKLQDFYEPDVWGQHPPWKWSLWWGTGHRQCYLWLSCRAGCNLEKNVKQTIQIFVL